MQKRTMIFITAMVLLFAIVTGSTIAYMTSKSDPVINTFSYGNITITLDEAKVDPATGKALTGGSAKRVQANNYKVVPGATYDKDPTVHVTAGSEKCYLFVNVENGFASYEEQGVDSKKTIADQMAANRWINVSGTNVWYYEDIVDASTTNIDKVLFNKVYVDSDLKGNSTNATGIEIKIEAYAVQADGMGDAKNAYNLANPPADATLEWPSSLS